MIKTITFKGRNEETGDWEVGALVAIDFRTALVLGSFERIDDFIRSPDMYRIKPEPKYRPFKNQEECWNEMLKHQPFGWVKSKVKGYFHLIGLVQWASELEDVMTIFATSEQLARSSRSLFEDFIFADGTPFGIKE